AITWRTPVRRDRGSRADDRYVRGWRPPRGWGTPTLYRHLLQPAPATLSVIFHSLDFVIFFIATVAIYWQLPRRGQNLLLLIASYFFYGYVHPWFLILIAASTIVDYATARGMEQWPERKRVFMGLSI